MVSQLDPLITENDFKRLIFEDRILIDVRSQIEFAEGHFPNSINLPILTTEERVQVGTAYVQQGPEEAIRLGHSMVNGEVKKLRVDAWRRAFENGAYGLTCFRGGLRSQTAQLWCREAGVAVPRVEGGTKSLRRYLMEQLNLKSSQTAMTVICGPTGSGKSKILNQISEHRACLDLESIAHHRGSAFGSFNQDQPSQISFENKMSYELIRLETKLSRNLIVEDESRMIGKCTQPDAFFKKLRESSVVYVDESIESRTQNIFDEYILSTEMSSDEIEKGALVFEKYIQSLLRITKKLGGARTAEVLGDLKSSKDAYITHRALESNKVWIRKLLEWYYDPLYTQSLEKRSPLIEFRGSRTEVVEYLS